MTKKLQTSTAKTPIFAVVPEDQMEDHAPEIPTTAAILFDPLSMARTIENTANADWVDYPDGFYLPGLSYPSIKPGETYIIQDPFGNKVAASFSKIEDLQKCKDTVYNSAGTLLVVGKLHHNKLKEQPHVPVHGLRCIDAAIADTLDARAQWRPARQLHRIEHELEKMLKFPDEAIWHHLSRTEREHRRDNHRETIADVARQVDNIITDLRNEVQAFIGDDEWVMHFLNNRGRDRVIEKTIDFRVYDWTLKTRSKEWHHG